MKKSTLNICIISGIFLWLINLYLAGAVVSARAGLEYRFWVDGLGKYLCMMVLPLWISGAAVWKLWQSFRENMAGRWLIRLFGGAAVTLCLFWCCFGILLIPFISKEDHYLGGGLISVVEESFPRPVRYAVYESAGPFFRRKISLTPEKVAEYLTDRYKRDFYPVEEDGKIFYADAGRDGIRVTVEYISGKLTDNYPQALADYYLAEGCEILGLDWEVCSVETYRGEERFCLMIDEEENTTAFGADVYRLIQHALEQEPALKQYNVSICLSSEEYRGQWVMIGFGSSRLWEKLSAETYGDDAGKVTQAVKEAVGNMRKQAWSAARDCVRKAAVQGAAIPAFQADTQGDQPFRPAQESGSGTVSAPESVPERTMREMAEGEFPEQCKAAEAIWEAELKDSGYDYDPGFNAKGNLVIWLGKLPSDNLQSGTEESDYYLTYDRESQNGNCYLFVLSEVPEGYGLNDAYLREFYACEKDTLKVVAGNKTSWAQTGCAEYRELTGE